MFFKLKIKLVFGQTGAPDPAGGAYNTPQTLSSTLERGTPLDVSTLAPRLSGPNTNSWLRLWPTPFFSGLQLAYALKNTWRWRRPYRTVTTDKLADVGAIVKKSPVFRLQKSGNPT